MQMGQPRSTACFTFEHEVAGLTFMAWDDHSPWTPGSCEMMGSRVSRLLGECPLQGSYRGWGLGSAEGPSLSRVSGRPRVSLETC